MNNESAYFLIVDKCRILTLSSYVFLLLTSSCDFVYIQFVVNSETNTSVVASSGLI